MRVAPLRRAPLQLWLLDLELLPYTLAVHSKRDAVEIALAAHVQTTRQEPEYSALWSIYDAIAIEIPLPPVTTSTKRMEILEIIYVVTIRYCL